MALSTYLGNKILDHIFNGKVYTPSLTIYVSLHTADPGLTGASEASGGGYARVAVTQGFGTPAAKNIDNDSAITFPELTSSIGTATHFGFWDAGTGGNFLFGDALDSSVALNVDSSINFAAAALSIMVV